MDGRERKKGKGGNNRGRDESGQYRNSKIDSLRVAVNGRHITRVPKWFA